jgi:hypothetical protein
MTHPATHDIADTQRGDDTMDRPLLMHGFKASALATVLAASGAHAAGIDLGDTDWALRFDNTLKGSLMTRTKSADPALADSFRLLVPNVAASAFPQALNFNAGDDNFRQAGLVSKRMDLLSEFDAVYRQDFGLRISGAAWYDGAYRGTTEATDAVNGQTPSNAFPSGTRALAGHKAEVLDTFVFGSWNFDDGRRLSVRLGQHALQYGESLFFGDNGIARAQGPVDLFKLQAAPNAQFKEIIRPVPQVSAQFQLSPTVSLGGYYQFRWESDRLPPSGSFFSTTNIPWGASQPEFVGIPNVGNFVLTPGGDRRGADGGQFGGQIKWRLEDTDLGFYAARYNDKDGQLYGKLDTTASPDATGSLPGTWYYRFPGAVKVFGASASRSFGDFNVASEASVRDNMPLRSTNMLYGFFPGQPEPRPATGRTAHLNLSTLATFGPSLLSQESSLVAELAWNRVLHKDDPDGELDAGRTRSATALQAIFTPTYRQVISGLDLDVPLGVRYTLQGQSAVTVWDAAHTGNVNLGLDGNYLGTWQVTLTFTHYFGKAVPFVDFSPAASGGSPVYSHGNPLADRDNVAFTLRRTF